MLSSRKIDMEYKAIEYTRINTDKIEISVGLKKITTRIKTIIRQQERGILHIQICHIEVSQSQRGVKKLNIAVRNDLLSRSLVHSGIISLLLNELLVLARSLRSGGGGDRRHCP